MIFTLTLCRIPVSVKCHENYNENYNLITMQKCIDLIFQIYFFMIKYYKNFFLYNSHIEVIIIVQWVCSDLECYRTINLEFV